ncbi:MAG: hypothetical protein JST23_13910 [Bacteroidetes bacterium]|nr:hypothetical protein [Bacteroidota bacterium]
MKPTLLLLLLLLTGTTITNAQKRKDKSKAIENYDSTNVAKPVIQKSKGKNKNVNYDSTGISIKSSTKSKGKSKGKTHPSQVITDYVLPEPKPDPEKNFIGIIKYKMTSDDPVDNDSVIVIFGLNKIRIRIFTPGYREGQVFENSMIANFLDSTFTDLDIRNHTYTVEKLSARNESTELNLMPTKNRIAILNNSCAEYKGDMTTKDEDAFEVACLLSPNQYFNSVQDYNFLGIHPIVVGYQIALGFKSISDTNEHTYIMAYKIEPGDTESWFDLSQYKAKK